MKDEPGVKTMRELEGEIRLPALIADAQGSIIYVNKPFTSVFGWTAGEIIGKPLTTIIPKNLHDAHHLGFSRFLATRKPTLLNQPLKLKAVTKDGLEFEAEHIILAEENQGQWKFGATIRPLK